MAIDNRPVGRRIGEAVEAYGERVREAAGRRAAEREAARGRPTRVDPMGFADPGFDTRRPAAPARQADIEMTVTAPRATPAQRPAAARQRPTTRREMSADDLNDMMLARMRGEAAPANESAARRSARENIARATPGFKKGGMIGSKPKAAAYKKGGPVKSAKRKK